MGVLTVPSIQASSPLRLAVVIGTGPFSLLSVPVYASASLVTSADTFCLPKGFLITRFHLPTKFISTPQPFIMGSRSRSSRELSLQEGQRRTHHVGHVILQRLIVLARELQLGLRFRHTREQLAGFRDRSDRVICCEQQQQGRSDALGVGAHFHLEQEVQC